jgi:hypothetical protein
VLSGRRLCDGLVTRPEESYRLWCVSGCDREVSIMRRPWPIRGCCAMEKVFSVTAFDISFERYVTRSPVPVDSVLHYPIPFLMMLYSSALEVSTRHEQCRDFRLASQCR